ncbi:alpha/beta fold hydrolase [Candidatus Pacearchaeota archaeon]|nr:alpha/beta fold hydrolase [Candidatus Pacearchaeota archaeon]
MNCIIVHGKADDEKDKSYFKHWIPWIKKKLEDRKIKVFTPLMPEPWKPNYNSWKKEFNKYNIDKNTILIGHSCGSAFLVRWLGETKKKIKRLILVAPWKISESENEKKFYNYKIDSGIRERVNEIIIFTSRISRNSEIFKIDFSSQ